MECASRTSLIWFCCEPCGGKRLALAALCDMRSSRVRRICYALRVANFLLYLRTLAGRICACKRIPFRRRAVSSPNSLLHPASGAGCNRRRLCYGRPSLCRWLSYGRRSLLRRIRIAAAASMRNRRRTWRMTNGCMQRSGRGLHRQRETRRRASHARSMTARSETP